VGGSHTPQGDTTSIEEATVSNMWEIAAIVELLERQGILSKGKGTYRRGGSLWGPGKGSGS
jgi:hypothetical protein